MREWDTLYNVAPPPPPPPPLPKNNFPMLYYGLVVVGAAAIVLAIYNLIVVKWCANQQRQLDHTNLSVEVASLSRRSTLDSSRIENLGKSFKYNKGEEKLKLGYDNQECPVCLSLFVEGEEVKQLPSCRHSFHAPCIDMWLYSHLDCPLCRSPVEPPDIRQSRSENENLREVIVDPRVHV